MHSDFWLTCNSCQLEWIGEPWRTDGTDERCPDCSSEDFEIGEEYHTPTLHKLKTKLKLLIVLLVPNVLLFWS